MGSVDLLVKDSLDMEDEVDLWVIEGDSLCRDGQ